MKALVLSIVCSIFISMLNAAELNVAVNKVRFISEEKATVFDINYAISYQDLQFQKTEEGFEAYLSVNLNLETNGKQVYDQQFTNKILLTNQEKTYSKKEYSDKISLTLTKSDFVMNIEFFDEIQQVKKNWSDSLITLPRESLISDLEMSTDIVVDTTSFHAKFHRDEKLYMVKPNHIFSKINYNKVCIYYELYAVSGNEQDIVNELIIVSRKDEVVLQEEGVIDFRKDGTTREKCVDVSGLDDGYYELELKIADESGNAITSRSDYFVVKESKAEYPRFFPKFEDDTALLKYFLNSKQNAVLKGFNNEAKKNYMERFWKLNDPNPITKENELADDIRERIAYSNQVFSHHKDGWQTDRGRIYIKNGPPDEISEYSTEQDLAFDTGQTEAMPENVFNINTKYAQKEYQIWKYNTIEEVAYIFLETTASGNMRLIYSDNDSEEPSLVNWKSMLGSGFDEGYLE